MSMDRSFTLSVKPEHEGMRLDVFVGVGRSMSRSAARSLIDIGNVIVDGIRRKASTKLTQGQTVVVIEPDVQPVHISPEDIPIEVLHEDDDIAVINKHPGLVVHPAGPRRTGTLVNALMFRWGTLPAPGGPDRPGIVHRLDVGTSGLIIVARNEMSYWNLVRQFHERQIGKWYRAVVWGIPSPQEGTIDAPIGRHPRHRQKMAVVQKGKDARTSYTVCSSFVVASELRLKLHTGRTHQIRVHLSSLNHPVLGDPTYGGRRRAVRHVVPGYRRACEDLLSCVKRPLLHAETLVFYHPRYGDKKEIHTDPPEDFALVLNRLKSLRESDNT